MVPNHPMIRNQEPPQEKMPKQLYRSQGPLVHPGLYFENPVQAEA